MSQENKPLLDGFLIFSFICLIILVIFIANVVFGESCQALSCGSTKMPTVVANSEYTWENDDQIGQLIREAEIKEVPTTKEAIVADVTTKKVKMGNYTTRLGYDGKAKPVYKLYGETKDDRAFEFLGEVGMQFTKDTWRAYGDKYKIDFTLPICIAWADSHLGKALKSKNNVGNIGNNDRGDVKHFDTLEAGIEAIYWSLAKGKYMSGHNTIGTLSGEGRKRLGLPGCNEEKDYRKKCYATSMGVWSTNVRNCMSAIHNKDIDENYNFRT